MPEDTPITSLDRPSLKDSVAAALETNTTAPKKKPGDVTVAAARHQKAMRVLESQRTNLRILTVTSARGVLQPGSEEQQHYADLAQFVGELHIMVITPGRTPTTVERPMRNVWVYRVSGRHIWQQVWNARTTALTHLRFNGVVQPDVLVATDPFESGLATWLIARAFRRPWQLHLATNYFSLEWLATDTKARKRKLRVARFVMKRARSIRTKTDMLKQVVANLAPRCRDFAVLPKRFNLEAYRNPANDSLHEQYHQYSFIMLAEGPYSADSSLHDVFAAVHPLLRQRGVALLVRGSGRAKSLFSEKAKLLGIQTQVIFESLETDPVSRYQGADIFIETDAGTVGDERCLRAIASSTPIVAYRNEFRADLITDGESGFLCEPADSYSLGQRARQLYNDSARRKQFAMRAKQVTEDQLHEDVPTYFMALRDTIATAITEVESSTKPVL